MEFAKQIMCLNDGKCNNEKKCDSCVKNEAKSNPDYYEIIPDGKKIKINQIREMQEKIAEKPIVSNRKVYIIDDANFMTEESQNCLLKTLEEPPEYAVIILIVSNENFMLATIKSRCVIVKFENLSDQEIKTIIPNISDSFAKILGGSVHNIEDINKKEEIFREIEKIVKIMENGKITDLFNNSDLLYDSKDDIINILEYMNIIFFQKKWIKAIEIVEKTKKKILANNNYELSIDYFLLNISKTVTK